MKLDYPKIISELMSNVEMEEEIIQLDEHTVQEIRWFKLSEEDYFWLLEQAEKMGEIMDKKS